MELIDISNGWFVGHSIKTHYGLEKIGIWQLTRPGKQPNMVRSRDVSKNKGPNKDGSIDK